MLTISDYLRYSKHLLVPEIREEGQLKIKNAKVLVIGAGGLGCPILQYLTSAGVGTLGVIDFDTVALHNLHRQVLYNETDINLPKVTQAKIVLEKLNPSVNIQIFKEKLTSKNAPDLFESYDIIVDGSDNFTTRYLVNDVCVQLEKPLVYGSIFKFEGQLAVFNHNGSKQLRDIFPDSPNPEDVPDCSLNGVISSLPGIIGTMMAQETLKMIIGLPVLKNELIVFSTLNWQFQKFEF
ncbi:thiamine biosynthesis protein ThiF [Flavobacterium columnare NBRC 100251 = ATCC 23463]|uniref:Molybdopterin-synthase adenylyltransferase n=1 Tax=Flavobacterium columnare TaxID=996 RepID=A0AAI8CI07_9FLAO|nr:HesA/MoeB/ThiF family protein [Flavobacterium columnare]AMO20506.1 HesA/MoeB/ThiF family protein [Flavobacterium columnare]APT22289.1 thiamine biosynthesis protein ThiF [Flavobacterium columnare]AUX18474.1 thiamine biosynthesis protein ThiF [Flavobacterium columnare]MBF6652698.1 HesA/MoeB/ThiF family protein [Flavobacterium columnare]MBF6655650.1 HesA/MoeB/ThiF family protein [Flavobacterium columnare]